MRVVMVCLGNICRSPMAAAVAAAMVSDAGMAGVEVESFGTAGYHVGEPADPQADAALRRGGWPFGGHRARQITARDVARSDMVLCADTSNLAAVRHIAPEADRAKLLLLRSFDPAAPAPDPELPDPWGRPDREFDRVLGLIERACGGLVEHLTLSRR